MIYDATTLRLPLRVRADLVVVGSGAGGGTVAMVAAEAGLDVVVLEAGAFVPPDAMTQREEEMLPELLVGNGGQTSSNRGVKIHQGRGVGGSTLHNLNLCKRIPEPILDHWIRERGLGHLQRPMWDALYADVEALLEVSTVPPALWNRHNRILEAGVEALGWKGGGLAHNRTGCLGSGYCITGCAYDAKNNAAKVTVPRAVRAGARVVSHCRAVTVDHDGSAVRGVSAVTVHPRTRQPLGEVVVEAPRVCVSASATGTPALLLRSRVPDPSGTTGRSLRVHPALVAAGEFAEPVEAWRGIPQTYECTEFLDLDAAHAPGADPDAVGHRTWIVPAFAHPVGTATMLPGLGAAHRDLMSRYAHFAVLTAMIHDRTAGVVRPRGALGLSVDYWPDDADRRELAHGVAACAELLFAAGASRVIVPTDPVTVLRPGDDLARLRNLDFGPGDVDVTAVHPMGSVPMGDDPATSAVDSSGRHHHLDGLWLADGSLFPTSIGGPPQLSIYALGLHVGRNVAAG